ncbi:MAG: 3-phosphoshikimate 1-carboxyvinyltransferase, partial [Lachnospiraceae bacterium]|nr:3-phosphoshikimate 1-carboxyvinyltransferase [Lachnospiraceae bacterium]
YHLDASAQMRKRPMAPLLASLRELGAEITFHENEGFFPFTISGHGFTKKELTVDINQSSQFLSALLIAAACSDEDVTIHTTGSHGMSYIEITRRMMEQFGVSSDRLAISASGTPSFLIPGGQYYKAGSYQIEPDVSAASYFYAMAPLLGIDVVVENVHLDSMQGDIQFLRFLEQMGCRLTDTPKGILLQGPTDGIYQGVQADMSACSDQAITMAALAPFAQTPTTITGIGHIRFQESDRISAIATELTRMGIRCEETADSITIWPGTPTPTTIHTYDDHRMAMGFSLIGLRAEGIVIDDPGCCRKTFENYFQVLDQVIQQLTKTN